MVSKTQLSFEFFPPKDSNSKTKLFGEVLHQLGPFNPEFISVTYGAGGSTRDGTFSTIEQLFNEKTEGVPHLSVGNDSDQDIHAIIKNYKEIGVKRILALRGDVPSGFGTNKIKNATYLINLIRATLGEDFQIVVAAYPEVHPDAKTFDEDIMYFKEKDEAGANMAITQYFYNPDSYANYLDITQKANINIPIIPGIMPISNIDGLIRMSKQCKAEIPRWLEFSLRDKEGAQDLNKFSIDILTRLCEKLVQLGAPGLHFYTLNRWGATSKICNNLGF